MICSAELASVFWEKAMLSMIETNNPVLIFMGYAVFACVTFGVLLAMGKWPPSFYFFIDMPFFSCRLIYMLSTMSPSYLSLS